MMKVITLTGRIYHIDLEEGFWTRFRKDGAVECRERIWDLQAGKGLSFPYQKIEAHEWEERMPVVGEHLYVSGKDVWYTSTEIVSIEEI